MLHAAAGECVTVAFRNERASARASFHVDKLTRTAASSGINAGFNPEQTIAPGEERTYRYFADSEKIGSAMIADFGDSDSGARGLYGAFVVAPAGAQFSDPRTGLPRDVGAQVDVKLPSGERLPGLLAHAVRQRRRDRGEHDALPDGGRRAGARELRAPRRARPARCSSPRRPTAIPSRRSSRPTSGDAMRVHVLGAPGSEQPHVFSMGGLRWSTDARLPGANTVEAAAVSPWTTTDLEVIGGAGGQGGLIGDMWYGDLRRPFTDAGMWGLLRVLPAESCDVRRLDGAACGTPGADPAPAVEEPVTPEPVDQAPSSGSPTTIPGTPVVRAAAAHDGRRSPRRRGSSATSWRRAMLTLRALRRSGLQFQVVVPDSARALRVELRRQGSGRTVATATVKLAAGGAQKVHVEAGLPLAGQAQGRPLHPPGPGGQGRPQHRTGQARAHARAPRRRSLSGRRKHHGRARRRPARTLPRRAPSRFWAKGASTPRRGQG